MSGEAEHGTYETLAMIERYMLAYAKEEDERSRGQQRPTSESIAAICQAYHDHFSGQEVQQWDALLLQAASIALTRVQHENRKRVQSQAAAQTAVQAARAKLARPGDRVIPVAGGPPSVVEPSSAQQAVVDRAQASAAQHIIDAVQRWTARVDGVLKNLGDLTRADGERLWSVNTSNMLGSDVRRMIIWNVTKDLKPEETALQHHGYARLFEIIGETERTVKSKYDLLGVPA